jgi:phosphotriesterase-related protein
MKHGWLLNKITRRRFLKSSLMASMCTSLSPWGSLIERTKDKIMTVTGEIPASKMGLTLPHEHVMVDFIGAAKVAPERYNRQEVFDSVLPYLKQLLESGCRTFMECTPAYLARDPLLLQQLSKATGLQILTNTGYYGARNDECLPAHAFTETARQLSRRWTREYTQGIENTGIRPGFIKIGVDEGKISDIDRKLVQAAAFAHLQTGLTIAAHTGKAVAALEEITLLKENGVHPSAWIWVHAQAEQDMSLHIQAAKQGAWVEFDGLGWNHTEWHVELVKNMKSQGLLHRALVSHDAGWYHVGEQGGGKFQPFTALFEEFLPALQKQGFTKKEIEQLLVKNPKEAFTIRVRKI